MNLKNRIALERRIVRSIVKNALAAGWTIAIDNGGDTYEYEGTNRARILESIMLTDDEHLYFFKPGEVRPFGWVYFVYGNDGWDVLNDYTCNLDATGILKKAETISEKYQ